MRKSKETVKVNGALLNVIAPVGLEFERNEMTIGENAGRIYGIIRYPMSIDYGWMTKLTNIPGTITSYTFTPIENGDFIESLNRNIGRQKSLKDNAQDERTRLMAEISETSGRKLLANIIEKEEAIGKFCMVIMSMSTNADRLTKVSQKVTSACLSSKVKTRVLSNLQKKAFKQLSPFYTIEEDVQQVTERIVPLSGICGGFANASPGLNDGEGFYFAEDGNGGLIFMDLWYRHNDRTNSDILVTGVKGQGKSTAVKHIALNEYMLGVKIIFIDPEDEYKVLTKKLNGDWINAGGGAGGRINPLQITPVPKLDEEELKEEEDSQDKVYKDEGHGIGALALYIQHLCIFFSLYKSSLSDYHIEVLKDSLIELYSKFNITWDTDVSNMKPDEFPIMEDLYFLLKEKYENLEEMEMNEQKQSNKLKTYYEDLMILLKDSAVGADAVLWNGYTTIEANSKCICLSTSALQGASDNIKRAQYFLLNSWTWGQISKDRNERVRAFYDEAYLMIDPNVPLSLAYLRNCMKRDRKYEGAMTIISHSVNDFLAKEIRTYGQALVDDPCYKIMFGTDGQNLIDTKKLYNLTSAEEVLLSKKQRSNALMLVGNKRLHVRFNLPDYEFEYFGKAGGR